MCEEAEISSRKAYFEICSKNPDRCTRMKRVDLAFGYTVVFGLWKGQPRVLTPEGADRGYVSK